ncbi:hypothetical protein HLH44_20525 [Gluconacetobacter sp. 1c LMG 22058]|uniref:Uncharacterized protein n=1 Tax=Gluconacetobacter dulcium TaxID=2729096 RepID=A0A7W4PJD8_9PROT|nr:hypothetical protein [Gluconacetobacter dulcium]MBB2199780.1 hypothetical protein [Gluconacetobacter dulcium]
MKKISMSMSASDAASGAYQIKEGRFAGLAAETLVAAGEGFLAVTLYKAIGRLSGLDDAISELRSRAPKAVEDGSLVGREPAPDPDLDAHIAALQAQRDFRLASLEAIFQEASAVADRILARIVNAEWVDGGLA